MARLDVAHWLESTVDEPPCGPDLEYDQRFLALERLGQIKPEKESGGVITPAEEPDWREVREAAEELMEVARDFRILKHLALAGLRLEGFGPFADSLQVAQGWLENFWDDVHPKLDPDDGDPTFRSNALLDFCNPDTMLKVLRTTPFVSSRAVGRFSLRDYRIATNKLSLPEGSEETPPTEAAISGACTDVSLEDLQATAADLGAAYDAIKAIDALLLDRISDQAPDFKTLIADLYELRNVVNAQVSARTGGGDEGYGDEGGGDGESGGGGGGRGVSVGQVSIRSRDDVVKLLDLICRYYELNEPASPVPLICQRAKSMVTMNFIDLLASLAPGGVPEAKNVLGIKDDY